MLTDAYGMPAFSINLVAALPAEAKPIARRFGLERVQAIPEFPVYRRGRKSLIISGPGKTNAAAATALLAADAACEGRAIWVNFGVAGHAERQVGDVLLANRITDAGSGRSWWPMVAMDGLFPSDSIVTLDRPDLSYERGGMIDMEASGFFEAASRFSPAKLVQVMKVISDNPSDTAAGLSATRVRQLVSNALDSLEALISYLAESTKTTRANH